MFKPIALIVLASLIIFMLLTVPACSETSGKPANADEVTTNLLEAVVDADFNRYRSYFAEELRDQLGTEQDFIEEVSLLQDTYGEYVTDSMNYLGFETTEEGQVKASYSAEFTIVSSVKIQTTFEKRNGEMVVVGFWLER
jgi:hypothetical protein